jgi:hypothetical protein
VHTLTQHAHRATRRLRWWRGLACGLTVAGLLGWGLPLSLAREDARDTDKDHKGLAQRVAVLEQLLKHFSREKNEIFITGASLHNVNGLGRTDCPLNSEGDPLPGCPNGLGNLIGGYNELCEEEFEGSNIRTGSHNVVVGSEHNFSRFAGLVVGVTNTISGDFASVTGGEFNTVSGGRGDTASGGSSSVSGGESNTASGLWASVSGGGSDDPEFFGPGNTATGFRSSVCGGFSNTASGNSSSVSGGQNITQATEPDWAAGSEGDEVGVGNFRSPWPPT